MRAALLHVCVPVWLGALSLTGCGDSPGTALDDEGRGPTNAAPLEELRVGMRRGGTLAPSEASVGADVLPVDVVIDSAFDEGGRHVYRVTSIGVGVDYLSSEPDGIYWLGSAKAGALSQNIHGRFSKPQLLVPKTVRVGMSWRADFNGDGVFERRFEVTDRAEVAAVDGTPRTQWTIDETKLGNSYSRGPELRRIYVEGLGLVGSVTLERPVTPGPAFDLFVTPLDPEPATLAPQRVRTALVPVPFEGGAEPAHWPLYEGVDRMGVLVAPPPPGGAAVPALIHFGNGHCVYYADGQLLARQPPPAGLFDALGADWSPGCPPFVWDVGKAAVHFDGDGAHGIVWMPLGFPGFLDGQRTPLVTFTDGAALRRLDYVGDGNGNASFGYDPLPGDAPAPATYPDDWAELFGHNFFASVRPGLTTPMWAFSPTGRGPSVPLVVATARQLVATASFDTTTGVTPLRRQLAFAGDVIPRADASGTEALVVSADGLVDRLVDDGGTLALERVAELDLPPYEFALGAFRDVTGGGAPDRLVVFTYQVGNRGPTGVGTPVAPAVRAYHAALAAPVPVPTLPSLTVSVEQTGFDLVVCWAAGLGEPSLDGWTLAGAPPAAVIPTNADHSCVLLIRDLAATAAKPASVNDFTVVGPVPGAGRVRVETLGRSIPYLSDEIGTRGAYQSLPNINLVGTHLAPLRGGGFATETHLLAPGAVVARAHPDAVPPGSFETVAPRIVDLGGLGLWHLDTRDPGAVMLAAPAGFRIVLDAPGAASGTPATVTALGPVVGGGLLVRRAAPSGAAELAVVSGDGRVTALPAPQQAALAALAPFARSADGLVWARSRDIADGEVTVVTSAGAPSALTATVARVVGPLADHQLVVADAAGVLSVLDADALTARSLDARPVREPCFSPDGTIWGVVPSTGPDDPGQVVQVTASGLQPVPLPPFAAAVPGPESAEGQQLGVDLTKVARVFADEQTLLVQFGKWCDDSGCLAHYAVPIYERVRGMYFRLPRPH